MKRICLICSGDCPTHVGITEALEWRAVADVEYFRFADGVQTVVSYHGRNRDPVAHVEPLLVPMPEWGAFLDLAGHEVMMTAGDRVSLPVDGPLVIDGDPYLRVNFSQWLPRIWKRLEGVNG